MAGTRGLEGGDPRRRRGGMAGICGQQTGLRDSGQTAAIAWISLHFCGIVVCGKGNLWSEPRPAQSVNAGKLASGWLVEQKPRTAAYTKNGTLPPAELAPLPDNTLVKPFHPSRGLTWERSSGLGRALGLTP